MALGAIPRQEGSEALNRLQVRRKLQQAMTLLEEIETEWGGHTLTIHTEDARAAIKEALDITFDADAFGRRAGRGRGPLGLGVLK